MACGSDNSDLTKERCKCGHSPIELGVKYALASEFMAKVAAEEHCRIVNVIELKSGPDGILIYWVDCQMHKHDLITEYAFMTWIKNPVFQKYYHGTKAFEKIAEEYIRERGGDQVA